MEVTIWEGGQQKNACGITKNEVFDCFRREIKINFYPFFFFSGRVSGAISSAELQSRSPRDEPREQHRHLANAEPQSGRVRAGLGRPLLPGSLRQEKQHIFCQGSML
jgi:hypothetical protein